MELKYIHSGLRLIRFGRVWIEPLWNWNWRTTPGTAYHHHCLNWTFMELKYVMEWFSCWQHRVWIEPLWNWNSCPQAKQNAHEEFELNLYGIEISVNLRQHGHTIVVWIEPLWNWNDWDRRLLFWWRRVWIEPLWNWNNSSRYLALHSMYCLNWTFMELKYRSRRTSSRRSRVWIEPLWNWNTALVANFRTSKRFELNLYGIEILKNDRKLWNQKSLNWTFMELKFLNCNAFILAVTVWIEPLWNWNTEGKILLSLIAVFELNLYGIEISPRPGIMWGFDPVWIEPLWNWNLERMAIIGTSTCLNWTFMELKSMMYTG